MADKKTPASPLNPPKGTDPRWREKIATAKRAREMANASRTGKQGSFRGTTSYQV